MVYRQQKIVIAAAVIVGLYLVYFLMYTTKSGLSLKYLREYHDNIKDSYTRHIKEHHGMHPRDSYTSRHLEVQGSTASVEDYIKTPTVSHDDGKTYTCLDRMATKYGRVEDIYCTSLGKFDPRFKNPCFYDYLEGGRKKLRCLPYFYIIGPDKCGTTDLHSRLLHHPQLMDNNGIIHKEASFWGWRRFGQHNFVRWYRNETTEFYMNIFDRTAQLLESDGNSSNVVTGDASPMDFYDFSGWRTIPQNLDKVEPEVLIPRLIREFHKSHIPKMIVHFRDPIERMFSLYVFLGRGNNPERFHADVLQSIQLLETCMATKSRRVCFFDGDLFKRMHVKLATSCYSVYLKEWMSPFPRSAYYITRLEDSSVNMKKTLTEIYNFLELEPLPEDVLNKISEKAKRHVTKAKVGVTMLPKTAEILKQFFKPCNEELARMLQDDRFLWNDTPHQ